MNKVVLHDWKTNVPQNSIRFRMSHDEPAKKWKMFHVRKAPISDSSLTIVLTFPCISYCTGEVEALLAAKALLKHGKISSDLVLTADEMYLIQEAHFSGGSYICVNEEIDLSRGIVAFMISGLKETVPIVIRISLETAIRGQWLALEIAICIFRFTETGFNVQ